ncbi:MAG: CDP-alcohol phosphatidyltransferase family protein, partial [Candidatus Marinamargulisbacteria bacterium]|nr:CDP-alcohol phosphatidyltransferase family protein [Candidatus Marinamargulisbacteria bacterium]
SVMALRIVAARQQLNLVEAKGLGKLKTAITLPICGILFGRVATVPDPELSIYWQPLSQLQQWVMSWPLLIIEILIFIMVSITVCSFLHYACLFTWEKLLNYTNNNSKAAKQHLYALIPNTFTLFNILFGLVAIYWSLTGQFRLAMVSLLGATVCDALDGLLARKLNTSSSWGEQLDSRADILSFGIAPSILIACYMSSIIGLLLGAFYGWSVYFRIKRFKQLGHSPVFTGLPSPVGAGFVIVATQSTVLSSPFAFAGISLVSSLLMISNFSYIHFRAARHHWLLRIVGWSLLICFLLSTIIIIDIPYLHDVLLFLITVYALYPFWSKPFFNTKSNASH